MNENTYQDTMHKANNNNHEREINVAAIRGNVVEKC